ncbi:MAG TPA: molybdopterin-binding protein [Polyangiaceae bacterium]
MQKRKASTAALLIVGNELLSGKVVDANLGPLAQTLRALGIQLARVSVLPDELGVLTSEIRTLARAHDVLFTSGGVGPTHDDVTIDAVAAAFGTESAVDPTLAELVRKAYGERTTEDHLRLALVPKGAGLATSPDGAWPTPVYENVWMLPGVPEVFREKLATVRAWLEGPEPFVSRAVYTRLEEAGLVKLLDRIVLAHPLVEIGSYPRWFEPSYRTKITFDGRAWGPVDAATQAFLELLPADSLVKTE